MARLLALFLSCFTLAGATAARADAGWTDYVEVVELIPTSRHYYEIQLALKDNPSGCREDDWFYLNYDLPGAEKMFDLFVDGIQKSLRLRVYVTGVCNLNGYSEISAVGASAN